MPWWFELKYWENGIRRCDIYPEKQQKRAGKAFNNLTQRGIKARLSYTCSSHNIEKEYREIRKGVFMPEVGVTAKPEKECSRD